MRLKSFKTFFLVLLFIFVSCEVSDVDKTAKLVTISELFSLAPGFEWFPYEFNKYLPDSTVSKQIDSLWKLKRYRFILFVNPSCNCEGTQVVFPMIAKCLKSGNVPDSAIIIYSMLNTSYTHPYVEKFKVRSLPSCFTEIDSSKYFSVVDTFDLYKLKFPGKFQMEHIILLSLQK
ncbi:MAG: hypothetical protein N2560_00790 [Ignavibacteria bacterium]|nr:hypothetical protein [Ignavibacteria bacterium]